MRLPIPSAQRIKPLAGLSRFSDYSVPLTTLAIAVCGLFALLFAIVMPPFQVGDEHAHFVHAYQISRGEFIGRPGSALPAAVVALLARYPEDAWDWHKTTPRQSLADVFASSLAPDAPPTPLTDDATHRFLTRGVLGTNLYTPVVYAPASAGVGLARIFRIPPLGAMYTARFMNVLAFVAGLCAACRLAPDYRALIIAVALLPMTLHQIGGVSADAGTIVISLIGFALILRTRQEAISANYLVLVLIAFVCWAMCKGSIWALPLLLLIPRRTFGSNAKRAGYIAAVAISLALAVAFWQLVNQASLAALQLKPVHSEVDISATSAYLVRHPWVFLRSVAEMLLAHGRTYAVHFIAAFSWVKFGPPWWVRAAYAVLLLVVALTERSRRSFDLAERVVLLSVFIAGVLLIHAIMFISDGVCPPRGSSCYLIGSGVQGRYFIPFCLAGLLLFKQRRLNIETRYLLATTIVVGVLSAVASLQSIWREYYI